MKEWKNSNTLVNNHQQQSSGIRFGECEGHIHQRMKANTQNNKLTSYDSTSLPVSLTSNINSKQTRFFAHIVNA